MKTLPLLGLVVLVTSCGGGSGAGTDKKVNPAEQEGEAQQSTKAPESETALAGLGCREGEVLIQGALGSESVNLKGTITNHAMQSVGGSHYKSAGYETTAGGKGFVRHDIGNPGQFSVSLPDGPMLCSSTFRSLDGRTHEISGWIKATKYDGGIGPLRERCYWQSEADKEAVPGTLKICFSLPQSPSSLSK